MINLKGLEPVTTWLLILGGVVLGLEGLANYDLLAGVLGTTSLLTRVVEIAVGVSAVLAAYKELSKKR